MNVTAIVLAAILSQPLAPDVRADTVRLQEIAEDIASVSMAQKPPVGGKAAAAAWALFYEAIAFHESGFLLWVERCEQHYPGANDGGLAVGLMQLHPEGGTWQGRTKRELCGNRLDQLRASGEVLFDRARACPHSALSTLRCYAGTTGRLGDRPAREILAIYNRALRSSGITMVARGDRTEALWTSLPRDEPADEEPTQ
jgi:hypothetical protein